MFVFDLVVRFCSIAHNYVSCIAEHVCEVFVPVLCTASSLVRGVTTHLANHV